MAVCLHSFDAAGAAYLRFFSNSGFTIVSPQAKLQHESLSRLSELVLRWLGSITTLDPLHSNNKVVLLLHETAVMKTRSFMPPDRLSSIFDILDIFEILVSVVVFDNDARSL